MPARSGGSWVSRGCSKAASARQGARSGISVQLVRASDGCTAWSSRFDRRIESVFAVQDEIATTIAQTLGRQVTNDAVPAATRPASVSGPLVTSTTSNAEVYSLYLEGRYLWNKRPGNEVWQALDCFERAVRIDPAFARRTRRSPLCTASSAAGSSASSRPPRPDEGQGRATMALRLDPRLAEAHSALAYTILHFDRDPEAACRELDVAIVLNPGWVDAHHWYSHALCASGRFAESLAASRRALHADPINPLMHAHLAWHHYMAREFEQALD